MRRKEWNPYVVIWIWYIGIILGICFVKMFFP